MGKYSCPCRWSWTAGGQEYLPMPPDRALWYTRMLGVYGVLAFRRSARAEARGSLCRCHKNAVRTAD